MPRSINHHRSPPFLPWHQAMLRYGRVVLWYGLLALAAASGGCQRGPTWNLAAVEGTITKGGRPLRGIQVVFLPDADTEGVRASGITDEAGHYRLRTDRGDDGVMVGKHRILVLDLGPRNKQILQLSHRFRGSQQKEAGQPSPENAKRLQNQLKLAADEQRVPHHYSHFAKTPLRVEVQPAPQVIDLEVK